ncbi:hypothetical protein NHQ30_009220 [Ciborinia camelliae]|nr:hypothetical protein NHQ30_009220 [Ciborinia camelliae]
MPLDGQASPHRENLFPRTPFEPKIVKPKPVTSKPKPITEKPHSPTTKEDPKPKAITEPEITTSTGESAEILTADQYKTRGDTVRKSLNDAISKNTASKIIKPVGTDPTAGDGSEANVFDGYTLCDDSGSPIKDPKPGVSVTGEGKVYDDLESTLSKPELGVSSDTSFSEMHWYSGSSKVNSGAYNPDKGIIIVDDVAGEDAHAITDPKKLEPSSITYQSYRQIARNKLKNLKMVIQRNLKNKGTRKMISDAYDLSQNLNITSSVGDWAMDATDMMREKTFLTLLGTDNGKPTVDMLTDFHSLLGNQLVERIFTFPYQGCEDVGDGLGCWHMALMTGSS